MDSKISEFILKLEELPILLNVLYLKANDWFHIYPYIIEENTFSVTLEKKVKITRLINKSRYQEIINEKQLSDFPNIVPKFEVLRGILIASGFLKMKNWSTILEELGKIKKSNPLKGERQTFIGLDTNCFIDRIYSVLEHSYKKDISDFYFVLSRIIRNELMSMKTISGNQLNDLRDRYTENHEIFQEFWNGDTLYTRTRHLGLVECNKFRKQSKYLINDGLDINKSREMDYQIIEDFRNQILKQGYNLLLLSSDKQFADQARQPGINSIYLERPSLKGMPRQFSGTWPMLCDFLYLNSVYFGAIHLICNKHKIKMFGIWRGKQATEWDSESVKIWVGSEDLSNLLDQQLTLVRT